MPKGQYVAQQARGAYITTVCQPEAIYNFSVAAQVMNLTKEDEKKLKE
jgi:hypothetical protein